ncbi:response regulator [Cytophagaceae bacterium YF14B1]|uniref:Response regulator n=1 Tax=Xanthocytophaga flava TaxID=3048013 RepID=A0AAE3QQ47_9BACT|nr:response regulator [Xanthocytophaga flavus]MDJ1480819.1 response regulator [Xanthocytophaga flavus]
MRTILIIDDDPEDRFLLEIAFSENTIANPLVFLKDGIELMQYIDTKMDTNIPAFILMDLNMPRMNGKQALQWIKSDSRLRCIPVLIYSTSDNAQEVGECYQLGANGYIVKPSEYTALVALVSHLYAFWVQMTLLPVALREK